MSRPSLEDARLLLVTDPREDLVERVAAAVRGGVGVVQLRDKRTSHDELLPLAEELREVCESGGAIFTVNDDPELARLSGAGVHIGQGDGSVERARSIVGDGAIIGRSAGNVEEVREAISDGVDYLGVGTIFATPTKPDGHVAGTDLIRSVVAELERSRTSIPFYAIGGITSGTAQEVAEAGAWGFAVVRAVLDAEDPEAAARELRALLP